MFTLKSFYIIWLLLGIISEIISIDYLPFGGTEEESRMAEYYLSADSGSNIGPTDELKRTQRSFWKKLFKNGLFGECDNCCNNCNNYNAGNGDNYSPAPSPLLPFQPFRPLPLWQNLQPLFGPVNYDSYGRGSYNNANPPSYNNNNVPPAPEAVYEIPTELPPAEPEYNVDNSPAVEELYEPPPVPAAPENTYSIPQPSTYAKEETPKANGKVPQIIYQPIIYVSPQYQGNKDLIKQIKQEDNKYGGEPKEEYKPPTPSYETESESKSPSPSYSSEAESTKSDDVYNKPEQPQTPAVVTPCSQSYAVPAIPCLSQPPSNPAVSTVSTVYNIITPSLLHSLTTGQESPYSTSVISPNTPCSNDGPSKYSFNPANVIPSNSYSLPSPAATAYLSPPTPMPAASRPAPAPKPVPAPLPQSYIQPIHLSSDDQPYRVCPELFQEYQRKLNMILPHTHAGRGGSTFVNAQLIRY